MHDVDDGVFHQVIRTAAGIVAVTVEPESLDVPTMHLRSGGSWNSPKRSLNDLFGDRWGPPRSFQAIWATTTSKTISKLSKEEEHIRAVPRNKFAADARPGGAANRSTEAHVVFTEVPILVPFWQNMHSSCVGNHLGVFFAESIRWFLPDDAREQPSSAPSALIHQHHSPF